MNSISVEDVEYILTVSDRILVFAWVTAIAVFFFLILAPCKQLNSLLSHGKLHLPIGQDDSYFVPKKLFKHYYLMGASMAFLFSLGLYLHTTNPKLICLLLFWLHCTRRVLETMYITEFGDAKLHILYYLGGMIFYIMYNCTLLVASLEGQYFHPFISTYNNAAYTNTSVLSHLQSNCLALIRYLLVSILQYVSHYQLYHLKRSVMKKLYDKHPLPTGYAFDYISCPHYFAEICIYLSMVMISSYSLNMWLAVIWVVVNLSVTAYRNYSWYLDHYPEEMEAKKRTLYILFPFVW